MKAYNRHLRDQIEARREVRENEMRTSRLPYNTNGGPENRSVQEENSWIATRKIQVRDDLRN